MRGRAAETRAMKVDLPTLGMPAINAWIAENKAGRPSFDARRRDEANSQLEQVGRELRRMMPFVDEADPGWHREASAAAK